jgi:hypothetical protein
VVDAFWYCIRGFVGDIKMVEEINNYVAEGLLRDRDEWYEIQKLAGSILMHRSECNMKQSENSRQRCSYEGQQPVLQKPRPN